MFKGFRRMITERRPMEPPKPGKLYRAKGFPGLYLVADDGETFVMTAQTGWMPHALLDPVSELEPYGTSTASAS